MGSDSNEPEAKETKENSYASQPVTPVCLEKLVAMNATKTELRLYTLLWIQYLAVLRGYILMEL